MKYSPKTDPENVNVSKENPLRELFILVAGTFFVLILIVIGISAVIELLADKVPRSVEVRIFNHKIWESAFGEKSYPHPELQKLVDRLRSLEPESSYNYRARILCEETPNAFAVPGGLILVTSGLVESIKTENGLAFVLGHELGHFKNRDHLRSLGKQLLYLALGLILGVAGEDLPINIIAKIVSLSSGRTQELAADTYGISLLEKLYGHSWGADEFFDSVAGETSEKIPSFLLSHPHSDERIKALNIKRKSGQEPVPLRLTNPCPQKT